MNVGRRLSLCIALVSLMSGVLAGCGVAVPARLETQVQHEQRTLSSRVVPVNLGPRRLLASLSRQITDANGAIRVVDGLLFRDTALPQGDWTLDALLAPATRQRVREQLEVDYLLVVGRPTMMTRDEEEFLLPPLGGRLSGVRESSLSAILFDLRTAEQVAFLTARSSGTETAYLYVLYVAGTEAQTEKQVVREVAEAVASAIARRESGAATVIAVMATEAAF